MNSSNLARARQLFEEVVDLQEDARAALLSELCAGDDELKQRVLELLQADAAAEHEQFLTRTPSADLTGARIGRYRVLRAIGSGGMGTVYLAEQDQPRRNVALKVLQPIFRSSSVLRRFTVESEILARLQHQGIAQVFDAGVHEFSGDGFRLTLPWYALEYLDGASMLTQYAQHAKLHVRARVRLLADVCAAVHHAHQKGVIHRDLKPANLLVDSDGRVKVIDFGVARVATTEGASTLHTVSGELLGTVRYMAPEQLAGDPDAVDTRSDVYALGVILFELLAGKSPLDLDGKSVTDAARIVRDDAPKRLRSIDASLPQDLEWICARALEKEPARRFASAAELQADLERFLNDEPAMSGPPSATYRVGVFVRRHRVLVGALAAVVGALAAGLVIALLALGKANREELRANGEATAAKAAAERAEVAEGASAREAERAKAAEAAARKESTIAQAITSLLTDSFAQANPQNRGRDLKVVDALESTAAGMFTALESTPEVLPPVAHEIACLYQSLGDPERAIEILETTREKTRVAGLTESKDYVTTLTNLVEMFPLVGRSDESLVLLDEADSIAARVVDANDSLRLRLQRQRGALLFRSGQFDAAEAALRAAYERHRDVLGESNIDTLLVLNDLAMVMINLDRRDEATDLFGEIAGTARAAFGDDNTQTLGMRSNYAASLLAQNRYDLAISEFDEILASQRRQLGTDHPSTVFTLGARAKCLLDSGDLERGCADLTELVESHARTDGDGGAMTLRHAWTLCALLNQMKRYDEGIARAHRHLAAAESTLPDDDSGVVNLCGALGYAYLQKGEDDEAEPWLLRSYEQLSRSLGANSPQLRPCAELLMGLYERRGDSEKASKYAAKTTP